MNEKKGPAYIQKDQLTLSVSWIQCDVINRTAKARFIFKEEGKSDIIAEQDLPVAHTLNFDADAFVRNAAQTLANRLRRMADIADVMGRK